jgi:hypothetical protein
VSLALDIGQGAGLASASGVRPFLPPLLAGALARGDIAVDFERSDWRFLESPGFLLAILALAIVSYGGERSGLDRRALRYALGGLGVLLGALLFAGSLAEGGAVAWPGLIAGALAALLGWAAVGGLLEGARRRLDGSAAGLLNTYADVAALALAALAIFVAPVAVVALAAFAFLLVRGQREGDRKYAGLRILR